MAKIKIRKKRIVQSKEIIETKNLLCQVAQNHFDGTQLLELLSNDKSSNNSYFQWLKTTFNPDIVEIGSLELDTDSNSFELHKKYREYLYETLSHECNIKDDVIGQEEIDQARLFIVEILLRMTAVALFIVKTQDNKAMRIIKLTLEFIGALSDIFKDPPVKDFLSILRNNEHINFLNLFSAVSEESKLLYEHKTIISETLELLEEFKYLVICRIIVELAPEKTASYLETDTIETTLTNCQIQIIERHSNAISLSTQQPDILSQLLSIPVYMHNQAKVRAIKNNINLNRLYELLNKLELATQITRKVADIITTGGWSPITFKMIKFERLTKQLNQNLKEGFDLFAINRSGYLQCNAGQYFDRRFFEFKKSERSFPSLKLSFDDSFVSDTYKFSDSIILQLIEADKMDNPNEPVIQGSNSPSSSALVPVVPRQLAEAQTSMIYTGLAPLKQNLQHALAAIESDTASFLPGSPFQLVVSVAKGKQPHEVNQLALREQLSRLQSKSYELVGNEKLTVLHYCAGKGFDTLYQALAKGFPKTKNPSSLSNTGNKQLNATE